MNTSNNIYNILNKLASLEPQPLKQESMLKQLNEGATPPNPLSSHELLVVEIAKSHFASIVGELRDTGNSSPSFRLESPNRKSADRFLTKGR